jgi:hypothetical protein
MTSPETVALFEQIGEPVRRSVCVVTNTAPLTITWNGQAGVLAEKINGSTVALGNAYVFATKAGRPLVFQTV